jgi:hypothetical protein
MAEIVVIGGILGLGYMMSQNGGSGKFELTNDKNKLTVEPSGSNIYESKRSAKVWNEQQQRANQVYKDFGNPEKNRMMAGPPEKYLHKMDYKDKQLPLEFKEKTSGSAPSVSEVRASDVLASDAAGASDKFSTFNSLDGAPQSGGWGGISLTGEPIDPSKFIHNNMQPHFGSSVKQNMDDYANSAKMEHFNGSNENYRKKTEVNTMSKPEMNVGNVYGNSNLDGYMKDRYIVSKIQTNVSPIEKTYVGPGLNRGYSSKPTGGYQQLDVQEYAKPKDVDELRGPTNPKVSYYSRINSGAHIGRTGKEGVVQQHKADTFYKNSPDRYFTTTGAVIAAEQRPSMVVKATNRKDSCAPNMGAASIATGSKNSMKRPTVKPTRKRQYKNDFVRNADATGLWSIIKKNILQIPDSDVESDSEDETPNDYGRSSINLKRQTRECVTENKYMGGVSGSNNEGETVYNKQGPRRTRKNYIVGAYRSVGNMSDGKMKGIVYDPNQVARTTIAETTENNDHMGHMSDGKMKGIVYDPNQVARTTIAETTENNDHMGHMSDGKKKGIVYDPKHMARTTTKEQTVEDGHIPTADATTFKGWVKDGDDVARVTSRQINRVEDYIGNPGNNDKDGAYQNEHAKSFAKPTNRQKCDNRQSLGGAGGGAKFEQYVPNKQQLVGTNRQTTSVYNVGGAQSANPSKPQTNLHVQNSTIRSVRGKDGTGHTANAGSGLSNRGSDKSAVKMTTRRTGDIQNQFVNERGVAPDAIRSSIPQKNQFAQTQMKPTLSNTHLFERQDIGGKFVQSQYRKNPYAQKLDAYSY